jgi:hypothetical protein
MNIQINKELTALQLRTVGIRLGVKQGVIYLIAPANDSTFFNDVA